MADPGSKPMPLDFSSFDDISPAPAISSSWVPFPDVVLWAGTPTAVQADLLQMACRRVRGSDDRWSAEILRGSTYRRLRRVDDLNKWTPRDGASADDEKWLRGRLSAAIKGAIGTITSEVLAGEGATREGIALQAAAGEELAAEEGRRWLAEVERLTALTAEAEAARRRISSTYTARRDAWLADAWGTVAMVCDIDDTEAHGLVLLHLMEICPPPSRRAAAEAFRAISVPQPLGDEDEIKGRAAIRRQVRTEIRRTRAQIDAVLRRVGGRKNKRGVSNPLYASFEASQARKSQKDKEKSWLDASWVTDGEAVVNLGAGAEKRAKARRSQAYAMVLGMDKIGKDEGLQPIFLTLTPPPSYHPNPSRGRNSFLAENGPVAGRLLLSLLWRDLRKTLWDAAIYAPFGLKVGELHQDAAPHLHALLWVKPDDINLVRDLLDSILPWQHGRAGRLLTVDGCSAASYIFPYLYDSLSSAEGDAAAEAAEAGIAGIATGGKEVKTKVKFKDAVAAGCADLGMRRLAWIGLERGAVGAWQRVFQAASAAQRAAAKEDEAGGEGLPPTAFLPGDMSDAMRAGAEAMLHKNWAEAFRALNLIRALNPRAPHREVRISPKTGKKRTVVRHLKVAGIELYREPPPAGSMRKSAIIKGLFDRATGEVFDSAWRKWEKCEGPEEAHEQLCLVEQGGAPGGAPLASFAGLGHPGDPPD